MAYIFYGLLRLPNQFVNSVADMMKNSKGFLAR